MNLKSYFYVYEFLLHCGISKEVIDDLFDSTGQNLYAREDE